MKILVLAGFGPSLINFRGELLREMASAGHEVHCTAPDIDAETEASLGAMGCRTHHLSLQRNAIGIFADLRYFLAVWRLCRRIRPDISLAYTIKPVIFGLLASRLAGVRLCFALITGLGYAFTEGEGNRLLVRRVAEMLYRVSLSFVRSAIFQNDDDRALFVSHRLVRKEKCAVVSGSGIDLSKYSTTPLPEGGQIVLLMIARLLKDKGVHEFAGAARILRAEYPMARFVLVGPFDSNPAAISPETVKAWQDEGIIEYAGAVRDVRPFIAMSSVYVLPSYREGTPRTVLEAMSMGRAVVTTDTPGCRETVIEAVNGYLVPAADAAALAEAIRRFLREPGNIARMGEESRRYAERRFDVRKVNQALLEIMGLTPRSGAIEAPSSGKN